VVIPAKKIIKKRAGFYISLFSVLHPKEKEKKNKKRLKKNKKKNVGEVVTHPC